jgi:cyclophilin family peptidyl-prolyl cis-trans isomerase
MAQHKAPVEVSIVTEEKSKFAQAVERMMLPFFLLFTIATVIILWRSNNAEKEEAKVGSDWNGILEARAEMDSDLAAKAVLAANGSLIQPYLLLTQANIAHFRHEAETVDQAVAAIVDSGHPVLTKMMFPIGTGGALTTLSSKMSERLALENKWVADNSVLNNDAPPAGSPEVIFETSEGTIRIALYQDKAPLHTANLLQRVEEKYFDNLFFSRVTKNRSIWTIQTGDPKARMPEDGSSWDSSEWSRENGPDETIAKEETGLVHDEGFVSMDLKPGGLESSGSQFMITLQPVYAFDQGQVVFGKVVEGMDVARMIGEGEVSADDDGTQIQFAPVSPIVITSATVAD